MAAEASGVTKVPLWAQVLLCGGPVLPFVGYVLWTRAPGDIARALAPFLGPLLLVLVVLTLSGWRARGYRRPQLLSVAMLAAAYLGLCLAGLGFYAVSVTGEAVTDWLMRKTWHLHEIDQIALVAGVLGLGTSLFALRLRWRSCYGLTEVMVGLMVALQNLKDPAALLDKQGRTFFLTILTAAVYLVVRGLDNVHHGLYKEPKDPVATTLCAWAEIDLGEGAGTDPRPAA